MISHKAAAGNVTEAGKDELSTIYDFIFLYLKLERDYLIIITKIMCQKFLFDKGDDFPNFISLTICAPF